MLRKLLLSFSLATKLLPAVGVEEGGGYGDPSPPPISHYQAIYCQDSSGEVQLRGTLSFSGNYLYAAYTSFKVYLPGEAMFFSDNGHYFKYDGGFGVPTRKLIVENFAYPNRPIKRVVLKIQPLGAATVFLRNKEIVELTCR